ncbi:Adenosylcobalamin/alpha-ribazole phosphatase [Ascidiaceihabitans donghaensis]|uniref:Adenosylcobalamin/alpha-ribazole phosphatase n=1 Tax=Ascidiaceihabitans donghaensis TaxID=1510460 RepID=A0A2R8B9U5_9RHOB|nr:histidine phosphatase family protein [Ascidiaceihabitans donghaensis]SPH19811.1 Adenosylcobalamin/alpha-ribazole phosphatase [Ascidiaceihabitans donghaensis]
MIRLGLLRHGHTAWNRAGRIQGRTDIPLDADASAALSKLCLPDGWTQADLWSSPLLRAVETAQLVASRAPRTSPALTEMNWGDWEGKHGKDLHADPASGFRDMEHWGWDFTPPNGEALSSLRSRTVTWAAGLQHDTVAVCHIGVMRVLMAHACGYNFAGTPPFQVKRNRLFCIEITQEGWTLHPDPIRLIEDLS